MKKVLLGLVIAIMMTGFGFIFSKLNEIDSNVDQLAHIVSESKIFKVKTYDGIYDGVYESSEDTLQAESGKYKEIYNGCEYLKAKAIVNVRRASSIWRNYVQFFNRHSNEDGILTGITCDENCARNLIEYEKSLEYEFIRVRSAESFANTWFMLCRQDGVYK